MRVQSWKWQPLFRATGATPAPHQVPADWVDRYKGQFDNGWDVYREQTLVRQIDLGVVPKGTKLASKPDDIVDWDTLTADEQRLYARQMEVFAAVAGRPELMGDRKSLTVYPGMNMTENAFINVKNRSHSNNSLRICLRRW